MPPVMLLRRDREAIITKPQKLRIKGMPQISREPPGPLLSLREVTACP